MVPSSSGIASYDVDDKVRLIVCGFDRNKCGTVMMVSSLGSSLYWVELDHSHRLFHLKKLNSTFLQLIVNGV